MNFKVAGACAIIAIGAIVLLLSYYLLASRVPSNKSLVCNATENWEPVNLSMATNCTDFYPTTSFETNTTCNISTCNASSYITPLKTHLTFRVTSLIEDMKTFSSITEIKARDMTKSWINRLVELTEEGGDFAILRSYTLEEVDKLKGIKSYIQNSTRVRTNFLQEMSKRYPNMKDNGYNSVNLTDVLWKRKNLDDDSAGNSTLTSYWNGIKDLLNNFAKDRLSKSINSEIQPVNVIVLRYMNDETKIKASEVPILCLSEEIIKGEQGICTQANFHFAVFNILDYIIEAEYDMISMILSCFAPALSSNKKRCYFPINQKK